MAVGLGPIASGLPKDLVQKLVEAEREPIRALEVKKTNEEARLKLVKDLSSKINEVSSQLKSLNRYRQFRELVGSSGRPELLELTVDSSIAEPGDYSVEVLQMSCRSSMLSNGFPDPNETYAGAGYFSYALPSGEEREVYIDLENSTLNGIAKILNDQKDLELQAIVVNDGTSAEEPYRLIITHKGSGEVNDAEFPDFYFIDGDQDFFMDEERPALNSKVKVNGFEVEFEGNSISSLLPGVNIDLKDIAPGKEFNISVKADVKTSKDKISGVVEKINEVLGFIQQQNKLDKDSSTRNTLGGDITLQNLESRIRTLVMSPRATQYGGIRFADMGVTFKRDGLLQLDENKLEVALKNNFEAAAQFFTGIGDSGEGFVAELDASMGAMTRTNGLVNSREEGIKRRIQDIDRQIENKERAVAQTERTIKERFAKLEGTIASLKQQQASVAATLGGGGGLPGLG